MKTKPFQLALSELNSLGSKLGLPENVVNDAIRLYRQASGLGLLKGRRYQGIAAASICIACRIHGAPVKMREVQAAVASVSLNDIARDYRFLVKEMSIKPSVPNPLTYVAEIARRAGLSKTIEGKAVQILQRAAKLERTSGKDPMGLAASALYAASSREDRKSQKTLAEAARVSEVTIRNRYKELKVVLRLQ